MSDTDENMRSELSQTLRSVDDSGQPSFRDVWRAAEQRHAASRRRYRYFASAAALLAVVVVGINMPLPQDEQDLYIDVAELLESTSWSAPSDVLLPDREFDIYQDLPMLTEST